MVIEVVVTMQLAMTEVEDYNTESISAEKCIIPQIDGHQWVSMGPWSPVLGSTVYTNPHSGGCGFTFSL